MPTNWDTETADSCRLPELIPGICNDCRDYRYCYKQAKLDLEGDNAETEEE